MSIVCNRLFHVWPAVLRAIYLLVQEAEISINKIKLQVYNFISNTFIQKFETQINIFSKIIKITNKTHLTWKRSVPTGGWAYGIPQNLKYSCPEYAEVAFAPVNLPLGIVIRKSSILKISRLEFKSNLKSALHSVRKKNKNESGWLILKKWLVRSSYQK